MLIATELRAEPSTVLVDDNPVATDAPTATRTRGEALRYLAASVAALALDALLLWVGVKDFAMAPWLAGAISYFAGLVLVYWLSIHWVFKERTVRDPRGEFLLFAALGVVGLVLNSATLSVATTLGLALPLAKGLSAGIGFVANFVSRKVLLFSGAKPGTRS
jgi:putative flippase GtrA